MFGRPAEKTGFDLLLLLPPKSSHAQGEFLKAFRRIGAKHLIRQKKGANNTKTIQSRNPQMH